MAAGVAVLTDLGQDARHRNLLDQPSSHQVAVVIDEAAPVSGWAQKLLKPAGTDVALDGFQ